METTTELTQGGSPWWVRPAVGMCIGAVGGMLASAELGHSLALGMLLGLVYGAIFAVLFGERCSTPGAGLFWGLGFSLFLWLLLPAGLQPFLSGSGKSISSTRVQRYTIPALFHKIGAEPRMLS